MESLHKVLNYSHDKRFSYLFNSINSQAVKYSQVGDTGLNECLVIAVISVICFPECVKSKEILGNVLVLHPPDLNVLSKKLLFSHSSLDLI